MIHKSFNLRDEEINGFMPTLTTYVINDCSMLPEKRMRPAVIVCPGGAYGICAECESEAVALQFMAAGMPAFVLDYAVAPNRYPQPQKNLSDAIRLVRAHAEEWGIDKDKIAVCGFSAGGHLAASVATMWDEEPLAVPDKSNRPNAAILCYPVISSAKDIIQKDTFDNLCGEDSQLRQRLSLENRVTAKTPPCFIWHTFDDELVPVQNSLVFALALKKAGVPCEAHIFPHGVHGLSLANSDTARRSDLISPRVQDWVELAVKWLLELFDKGELGS